MKKIKKIGIIALVCCLLFVILRFISPTKLYGKWYLYKGSDIRYESYISKQLNQNDYMEISGGTIKEFRSDGKDGISDFSVIGNKIYIGDAILKYEIKKVGEYKVLVLQEIGYDNGHMKHSIENSEKKTYVLDKDINFE